MDYHRPLNESQDHPRVAVALVLVPGKHEGPKKFSTSPMMLNPGGPGGSGVAMALTFGGNIHNIIAEDQDVIGFDPRGVGATTPRTDCFSYPNGWPSIQADDPSTGGGEDYAKGNFNRLLWATAGRAVGNANSSSGSWQMLDSRSKAQSKICQAKDAILGNYSIFRYVNTPNVVRDMVSIIDAWDEWTDAQGAGCGMDNTPDAPEDHKLSQTDNGPSSTKGKLVFWGFSYGVSSSSIFVEFAMALTILDLTWSNVRVDVSRSCGPRHPGWGCGRRPLCCTSMDG